MIPALLRRLTRRPPDPLLAWAIAQAMSRCERGHPWSPDIGPATCPDCWAEDRGRNA